MRRWVATALGLCISLGTALALVLQRYIADIDDAEYHARPSNGALKV